LESLAQQARQLTQKRFGKTIELYAPLYISNRCSSWCTYCNFSVKNKTLTRTDLDLNVAQQEMEALQAKGIDDILLLTGEMEDSERIDFLLPYIELADRYFTRIGVEIFPCSVAEYQRLRRAGVSYVTIYQETYDREVYAKVHKAGQKRDYDYRYQTPERVFQSGIRGIGMGALLGLADPVYDLMQLARHTQNLRRDYWDRDYSISFPRIRDRWIANPVSDRFLARAVFLFRLLFPDATLVLSTRESQAFRNGMAGLGINKMSAGSKTTVGGYDETTQVQDKGQFEIEDRREVEEVVADLRQKGLSPVRKNHEKIFI
jgi:2-iminoacetate synthase